MTSQTRKILAIDIDDVVADVMTTVRLWANQQTGASLTHDDYYTDDNYWEYYDSIWRRHGVADRVAFDAFLHAMASDQSNIPVMEGARQVIETLKPRYDLVFITSRPMAQKDETRRWLDEHIDPAIPLYIAHNPFTNQDARSKGEICAELGAHVLIDDNVGNCQSALQYGVDAILFGVFGWNDQAPDHLRRCASWREVGEFLLNGIRD